ncbi:serine hydrolase domain-containing protein [Roseateles toxinivorans]|uniref:CubicO group peptidase (Beta-lactamase class C family) n=1 Tax=Roseateles toxinivorans TaxID=270368 RepID=A0A4R6QFD2_9BURK|nr:serine hydrolase domain-containing protein [Roseateles toxinivorans]TDP61251.1 CubicO group peptidase (beta-lactamase class C family) [Roseateles toxinivorans]
MIEPIPLPAALAATLTKTAHEFGLPGLAISLVAPGRCSIFTAGVEAPGSQRPVTGSTWFSVASLGKHVTACAVLDLAQSGTLDLEAPIGRYLPDVPSAWSKRTVLSLLRHTSGLPEYLAYTDAESVPERRDGFMRTYGGMATAFEPDQGWIYTNTNYILLGFLIAQLARRPYAAAVQALFDRVNCVGATVAGPQWTREANEQGLGIAGRDVASAQREVIGDGDISFTAQGALAWLQALLGDQLLSAASMATMFSPAPLLTGRPSPYGCGWFVDTLRGAVIGHHAGHYDGWTAMAFLSPAHGCGVVAMCNLAPGNTRAVRHLAQLALEGFAPGSTPLSLPGIPDDSPALTSMAKAQLLRNGTALDQGCFAEELLKVVSHGNAVRNVINLWAGDEPLVFELVEQQCRATHRLRRYRIRYTHRVEHLLVGTTSENKIYWAWPL